MKRRGHPVIVAAAVFAAAAVGLMATGRPILFRLIDPTEVTRDPMLVITNPLRDKGPELAAEHLLRDLRERRLEEAFARMQGGANERIREAEAMYHVVDWRLINRKDDGNVAALTYMVSRKTSPPVRTIVHIRAERSKGVWEVNSFAPIY